MSASADLSPELSAHASQQLGKQLQAESCRADSASALELEHLLSREYNVLSIQTQGQLLLEYYVRCVESGRAANFLGARAQAATPEVRIWFLRALVDVGDPKGMAFLVAALEDESVYAYLESEPLLMRDAVLDLVKNLFGRMTTPNETQVWQDWWTCVGEQYEQAAANQPR